MVRRAIPAGSVPNAEKKNLQQKAGLAPVVQSIKESSALSAVLRNRQGSLCTDVINADGNRRTRRIRLSSVRNAEILLTTTTLSNGRNKDE